MTVFVVSKHKDVMGIFSTLENADEFIKSSEPDYLFGLSVYLISEYIVDGKL